MNPLNRNEIYVQNEDINLLETPTSLTYIILPNKTDNTNTLWMMANHWLKVLDYDVSHASSIMDRHSIPKITLEHLNDQAAQSGYTISNKLKLPIRSTTLFMSENSVINLLIKSKQPKADTISINDVETIFKHIMFKENVQHSTSSPTKRSASLLNEVAVIHIKKPRIESTINNTSENTAEPESFKVISSKMVIQEKLMKFGENLHVFVYLIYNEKLWLLAKNICNILLYENCSKAILDHVTPTNSIIYGEVADITKRSNNDQATTVQKYSKFINEAGLYQLIMKSKSPKAKELQQWIIYEVVPSLKRTIQEPKRINTLQSVTKAMENTSNKLQIKEFEFDSKIVSFRYINSSAGVWFVAKDMASMLCYYNPGKAIREHVSDYNIQEFDGGPNRTPECDYRSSLQNQTKLINEAGLYELIIGSKMPKAQEFKKWVVCDVLPSLRKTGHYSMQQASMSDAENLNIINRVVEGSNAAWFEEKIKLLEELREKDRQMHETIHEKDQQLHQKDGKIIHLQQKVIEIKPLIVSVPEQKNKFHVIELLTIKTDDTGFKYGYFCSRRQECSAIDARPKPEEEPVLLFSIKCANAINAYNCVKEYLRKILS